MLIVKMNKYSLSNIFKGDKEAGAERPRGEDTVAVQHAAHPPQPQAVLWREAVPGGSTRLSLFVRLGSKFYVQIE